MVDTAAADGGNNDDPPPPSWTTCPLPTCRGAVHERPAADPDGDTSPYWYCSSCGHLI